MLPITEEGRQFDALAPQRAEELGILKQTGEDLRAIDPLTRAILDATMGGTDQDSLLQLPDVISDIRSRMPGQNDALNQPPGRVQVPSEVKTERPSGVTRRQHADLQRLAEEVSVTDFIRELKRIGIVETTEEAWPIVEHYHPNALIAKDQVYKKLGEAPPEKNPSWYDRFGRAGFIPGYWPK
jgi:hypothetical protein